MSPPVRRATSADAPSIGALLHRFNREFDEPTPSPEALAERLRALMSAEDPWATCVLLAGEAEPLGLVVFRFRPAIWSSGLECYVAELYVVPERRREGFGRALMVGAIAAAKGKGADTMDLGTGHDDVAARALYESLGFDLRGGRADGPVNYVYERVL